MKKALKLIALALAVVSMFAFAGCKKVKAENVKVIDIELTAESYAFVVQKGDSEMQSQANELLSELKQSGELETIIDSFFNGTATFEYTNPASKSGCLVVATNAYFPPFEYYNGNKLTGVDMKIASLLAEKLNKTLYIDDMEFDAVFTSVENGLADIGMAGITYNAEREQTLDFTDEYYESAQVLVVKESDTLFADCETAEDVENVIKAQNKKFKIGSQNGTTGYMYTAGDEDFGYDGFANVTAKGYTTGALAIKDLSNGKLNAVVIDKQPAIMITNSINK